MSAIATITAISYLADASTAILALTKNVNAVAQLVARAQAENRDITADEWALATGVDDRAAAALDAAIAQKAATPA